jgi:zinc transport system substrate-binding protein
VIDLREGIRLRTIEEHDHDYDADAAEPALAGERRDPHIWLDPTLGETMARTITGALAGLDKKHSGEFEANYERLVRELDSVNTLIDSILAPVSGSSLFVFHPSYGYFCDRYGLRQVAIEHGGKEPSPRQLQAMIASAREADVKAIFVQQQFSATAAQAIAAAIGAKIVVVDPLARDYLNNLVSIAQRIAEAYDTENE